MDILNGKKTMAIDRPRLISLAAPYEEILLDVGTGSGRFVYSAGRAFSQMLCIGVDAERRGMEALSARATRKPVRGGAPNVLFALSAANSLPAELRGLANRITINLPWGSLLEGIVKADEKTLISLRDAAAPGALLEILMAYDEKYEPAMLAEYGLPPLTPALIEETLPPAFAARGVEIVDARIMDNQAVKGIPLDWGRALARGRKRDFYLLVARAARGPVDTSPERSLLLAYAEPRPAPGAEGDIVRFHARGHANLLATHEVSVEFMRDADLSAEGDCIVGVAADFDPEAVQRLAGYRKLHVKLKSGPVEETFECGVNEDFSAEDEIVFRKSSHCSARTLGIGAGKSSAQLSRLLADRLKSPGAVLEVVITPLKGERR